MRPRAVALGIVERNGRILVERITGKHSRGEGRYFRPLGGGIEFGEHSRDGMVREFREEIGAEKRVLDQVGIIENIFTVDGNVGHEIVFLYRVEFADPTFYEKELFPAIDGDPACEGVWVPMQTFLDGEEVLYPTGLTELLRK